MNRILSSLMAVAVSAVAMGQHKVYLSEDFNKGIPQTFTVLDMDQNPISRTLYKDVTFSDSWAANAIVSSDNMAAFSFSRASYEYEQENWMITPPITLDAEGEAYLLWKAKSVHRDFLEDYKIMVSVDSDAPRDFFDLYGVSDESYFWKNHAVSLGDFAGKTIYIAFVCTSLNKYILAIDDVFVGEPDGYNFEIKNTSSRFAGMEPYFSLKGTIRNVGRTAYSASAKVITDDAVIPLGTYAILPEGMMDYEAQIPIKQHSVNRYDIMIDYEDGSSEIVYSDSIISSYFPRTLVLEEASGNWCNNCPMMLPYLAEVKERMGDDVIVISAHIRDPLQCPVYSTNDGISRWLMSLPSTIYNRKSDLINTDAYHTDGFLERAMLEPTTAMITATAEQKDDKIIIKSKVSFGVDYDNSNDYYRVGFALVDDEYSQGDVSQANSCTLYNSGEYKYLPTVIPGEFMLYHDVPIEGTTAFAGIPGCFPAQISAGATYDVDYEMTIPEGRTYGYDDLTVVAFVIQQRVGNVLNATSVPLKLDAAAVGIADASVADGVGLNVVEGGKLVVTLPESGQSGIVCVYGLDGRMVKSSLLSSSSSAVDCHDLKGCYIVKVSAAGKTVVKKIVL